MEPSKAARAALMLARPKRDLGGAAPYSTSAMPVIEDTPETIGGRPKKPVVVTPPVIGGIVPEPYNGGGSDGGNGVGGPGTDAGISAAAAAAGVGTGTGETYAGGGAVNEPDLNQQGLYSHAAQIAQTALQQQAPPDQMRAALIKKGVKPDELKWSGFDEKLGSKPMVTRDEVAQHFKSGIPNLQETVLGAKDMVAPGGKSRMSSTATKYSSYTLPGGMDYREVLLHLPKIAGPGEPQLKADADTAHQRLREAALNKTRLAAAFNETRSRDDLAAHSQSQAAYAQALAEHEEALEQVANTKQKLREAQARGTYKSSHWDQPNVVVHQRLSDRPLPGGKKALHLEEQQSDWGQEGRERGFLLPQITKDDVEYQKIPWKQYAAEESMADYTRDWRRENGHPEDADVVRYRLRGGLDSSGRPMGWNSHGDPNKSHDDIFEMARSDNDSHTSFGERNAQSRHGIPQGPYLDSTAKWTDLGLKRALYEAAKGGYDKLLITPGEEQANRYNLSHKIKKLDYYPDKKYMHATTHDDHGVEYEDVTPENLHTHIGKEAAERILQQPVERHEGRGPLGGEFFHTLEGDNLKVGGNGMKGYYDKILPLALNKLARKHDPEAEVKLYAHELHLRDALMHRTHDHWEGFRDWTRRQSEYQDIGDDGHIHQRFLKNDPNDPLVKGYLAANATSKLHSLDITPKMRASILKGSPAYAKGGRVGYADGGGRTRALIVKADGGAVGTTATYVPDEHPAVQEAKQVLRQSFSAPPRIKIPEYPISQMIARGVPLQPRNPHPTDDQVASAKADDRMGAGIVNKRLDTIVPERERVAGGTYTPGAPSGGRWADELSKDTNSKPLTAAEDEAGSHFAHEMGMPPMPPQAPAKLIDQPGKGFKVGDDELDNLWKQSLEESSQAAKNAATKHSVHPTFGARDWDSAMRLPLRDHLWYELSGEKLAENLPDLTAKQHMKFLDVIGATSARAKPDENLERSLSVMSQHMRGVPIDVDLTIPSTVRQALARDSDGTSALPGNKTGHFSDTLALTGGVPTRFPISVNDVWVGKMFGVPDDVMSGNQSLHEPMAKYFNKIRDLYNERMDPPFKYQSWNFQAPAWVHLRNLESGAAQGDAYHQVWDGVVGKLKAAGVPGVKGDQITKEALLSPKFADALRRTTKPFRDAPKATVEFGTTQTPIGKRAHELYHDALDRGDELSQHEYLKGLTTAMYQSARGKDHPWDSLKKAVTGDVTRRSDITRIAAPTSDSPLDIGGTFEGAVSPNIRIPLKDMTDGHIEAFNAIAGKHLRQDAMATSQLFGAEQGSQPREGYIRGHSIFVPTTEQIQPAEIRAFAKEMGDKGHSMSFVRYPNGYHFDVLPSFTDSGVKGVTEETLDDAYGKTLKPGYGTAMVLPHDFKSVYTDAGDYDKVRGNLLKGIKDDFVQQAVAAGATKRAATAAATAKASPQDLPRGGKEAWDVYRARLDHLTAAEKGFKNLAQRVADAHRTFIGKAEKRKARPAPPGDPDAPPFARGGGVNPVPSGGFKHETKSVKTTKPANGRSIVDRALQLTASRS